MAARVSVSGQLLGARGLSVLSCEHDIDKGPGQGAGVLKAINKMAEKVSISETAL